MLRWIQNLILFNNIYTSKFLSQHKWNFNTVQHWVEKTTLLFLFFKNDVRFERFWTHARTSRVSARFEDDISIFVITSGRKTQTLYRQTDMFTSIPKLILIKNLYIIEMISEAFYRLLQTYKQNEWMDRSQLVCLSVHIAIWYSCVCFDEIWYIDLS